MSNHYSTTINGEQISISCIYIFLCSEENLWIIIYGNASHIILG